MNTMDNLFFQVFANKIIWKEIAKYLRRHKHYEKQRGYDSYIHVSEILLVLDNGVEVLKDKLKSKKHLEISDRSALDLVLEFVHDREVFGYLWRDYHQLITTLLGRENLFYLASKFNNQELVKFTLQKETVDNYGKDIQFIQESLKMIIENKRYHLLVEIHQSRHRHLLENLTVKLDHTTLNDILSYFLKSGIGYGVILKNYFQDCYFNMIKLKPETLDHLLASGSNHDSLILFNDAQFSKILSGILFFSTWQEQTNFVKIFNYLWKTSQNSVVNSLKSQKTIQFKKYMNMDEYHMAIEYLQSLFTSDKQPKSELTGQDLLNLYDQMKLRQLTKQQRLTNDLGIYIFLNASTSLLKSAMELTVPKPPPPPKPTENKDLEKPVKKQVVMPVVFKKSILIYITVNDEFSLNPFLSSERIKEFLVYINEPTVKMHLKKLFVFHNLFFFKLILSSKDLSIFQKYLSILDQSFIDQDELMSIFDYIIQGGALDILLFILTLPMFETLPLLKNTNALWTEICYKAFKYGHPHIIEYYQNTIKSQTDSHDEIFKRIIQSNSNRDSSLEYQLAHQNMFPQTNSNQFRGQVKHNSSYSKRNELNRWFNRATSYYLFMSNNDFQLTIETHREYLYNRSLAENQPELHKKPPSPKVPPPSFFAVLVYCGDTKLMDEIFNYWEVKFPFPEMLLTSVKCSNIELFKFLLTKCPSSLLNEKLYEFYRLAISYNYNKFLEYLVTNHQNENLVNQNSLKSQITENTSPYIVNLIKNNLK
ncbi:hypothetical protein DLAC_05225 [Tieghemostelium lacteum]|uniref:Uncharacterized protein n=1 Tax=Tieghemostelium lacteum TaxID=361077 RepID=A0A151ZIT3_TIELA|nr:hypothetical protein DLAC_05225 [Tieghemostelium lacteum]|eukprot:KYQ93827.1 hypothetical protein DLAC_05225 [Tieghemostelium lacteum]